MAVRKRSQGTTLLVTDRDLYYGEQVRNSCRLISNQPVSASDQWVYLKPGMQSLHLRYYIALVPKDGAGKFIGQTFWLSSSKKLFAKAFNGIGKGLSFWQCGELETLAGQA